MRVADAHWEPATRLPVPRLNTDGGRASRRYYTDEDAPEPLPLFPEPLFPMLPCLEFTSSIAA